MSTAHDNFHMTEFTFELYKYLKIFITRNIHKGPIPNDEQSFMQSYS